MDIRPIGVFDSGLGGLTAMRALRRLLPHEDFIYLGDTARVPYGTRSAETVIRFALQDAQFLRKQDVKLIVVACGTVSSIAMDELRRQCPVPVVGIVEPCAQAAVTMTRNHHIAILGTNATIRSHAIERKVIRLDSQAQVKGLACPLLVPLIENGYVHAEQPLLRIALQEYISQLIDYKIDTIILGCTHYPLVSAAIRECLPGVGLIDSGSEIAQATATLLTTEGLTNAPGRVGSRSYFVTDTVANFTNMVELFLGGPKDGEIRQVDIGSW
ncbi:MAG: glutamate racemase [Victivallales bacterium]|nr:glutamate racemase [Victivallales bacterium]